MKSLTKQEILDKVSKHLLTQMKKSMDDIVVKTSWFVPNGCTYRNKDGLSCAIGCLISDDVYDPSYENYTITSLLYHYLPEMKKCGLNKRHLKLLNDLQYVHDNSEPITWRKKLEDVAVRHKLKFNYKESE